MIAAIPQFGNARPFILAGFFVSDVGAGLGVRF
jgi:hypothetical protein